MKISEHYWKIFLKSYEMTNNEELPCIEDLKDAWLNGFEKAKQIIKDRMNLMGRCPCGGSWVVSDDLEKICCGEI